MPERPPAHGERSALLHIDWTRCDGRGLCTELLAGRLVRDEWGYPLASDGDGSNGADGSNGSDGSTESAALGGNDARAGAGDRSNVLIPPTELAAAVDAVALCPRQALRLIS